MPKIRKQPRRSSKKVKIPSLKNPFLTNLPLLPLPIAENLRSLQRIVLRHLDEILCQPTGTLEANIDMMKTALSQQELKINGLKQYGIRKKSATQAQEHELMKEVMEQPEEKSSNQLLQLDAPSQRGNRFLLRPASLIIFQFFQSPPIRTQQIVATAHAHRRITQDHASQAVFGQHRGAHHGAGHDRTGQIKAQQPDRVRDQLPDQEQPREQEKRTQIMINRISWIFLILSCFSKQPHQPSLTHQQICYIVFSRHLPLMLLFPIFSLPSPWALFQRNYPMNSMLPIFRHPLPSRRPCLNYPSYVQSNKVSLPLPWNFLYFHIPLYTTSLPIFRVENPSSIGGNETAIGLTAGTSQLLVSTLFFSKKGKVGSFSFCLSWLALTRSSSS